MMKVAVTEEQKRLRAVHHVVHDYANLVSSGNLTQPGPAAKAGIKPPVNTHIQHAFLLNCRKMAAFFLNLREANDILSKEFLQKKVGFKLSWKEQWHTAMNRQLLHLSYDRVDKAKPWDGKPNKLLLQEFQAAWKLFLSELEEPYKSEFGKQITGRQMPHPNGQESEFKELDLR